MGHHPPPPPSNHRRVDQELHDKGTSDSIMILSPPRFFTTQSRVLCLQSFPMLQALSKATALTDTQTGQRPHSDSISPRASSVLGRFCKKQGITELTSEHLEGPAYEVVKAFHPDVYTVSRDHFPLGGSSQHHMVSLTGGSRDSNFYTTDTSVTTTEESLLFRTHLRLLSVVSIEVGPHGSGGSSKDGDGDTSFQWSQFTTPCSHLMFLINDIMTTERPTTQLPQL
ncbi:hypothetical protein Tco_0752793 [Tanacetum coccineum]|uniref:Uncharacterized protein n=1 Tax=Tanacetum coccineum TaxID=301880 RepID=A0ABQ4Z8R5_9ASTR